MANKKCTLDILVKWGFFCFSFGGKIKSAVVFGSNKSNNITSKFNYFPNEVLYRMKC